MYLRSDGLEPENPVDAIARMLASPECPKCRSRDVGRSENKMTKFWSCHVCDYDFLIVEKVTGKPPRPKPTPLPYGAGPGPLPLVGLWERLKKWAWIGIFVIIIAGCDNPAAPVNVSMIMPEPKPAKAKAMARDTICKRSEGFWVGSYEIKIGYDTGIRGDKCGDLWIHITDEFQHRSWSVLYHGQKIATGISSYDVAEDDARRSVDSYLDCLRHRGCRPLQPIVVETAEPSCIDDDFTGPESDCFRTVRGRSVREPCPAPPRHCRCGWDYVTEKPTDPCKDISVVCGGNRPDLWAVLYQKKQVALGGPSYGDSAKVTAMYWADHYCMYLHGILEKPDESPLDFTKP